MADSELDLATSYFTTRLQQARYANQLPTSAQFDLARSPISDDELEETVSLFRDTPAPTEGWGIAPMLNEVLSSQPKAVPIQDLSALQRNLVVNGYADPSMPTTGEWDPSWYASLRRFDRDNFEKQRAGYHWYSAPLMSATNALSNTIPSRVFQGIVGTAKGLVTQAPETAERLGVLGSAGVGAGLGTLVAPGIGTAVGAAIGAGVGALSEAFFNDEEGEDEQGIGAFLEVVSPWGEYQKPQELWEDLGYVLTAASVVSGVGTAAKGVLGGVKAIQGLRTGTTAAVGDMTGMATAGTEAGMGLGKAFLTPTRAVGQTELGFFGTISRAATNKFLPGSAASYGAKLAKYSPTAFVNRTGPKMALDVFGGLSGAQMGGRLFGGIGQGSSQKYMEALEAASARLGRDLTEEEKLNLQKTTATSTIEQSIAEAPIPKTGIEIPLVGDAIDLVGFALYPQRLLPKLGGVGLARSAMGLMGDTALSPYVHALQHGADISLAAAKGKTKEQITAGSDVYMRLDYGIDARAGENAGRLLKAKPNATLAESRNIYSSARADIVRQLHELPEEEGKALSADLIGLSQRDDTGYIAHLKEITAEGRGLNRFGDFLDATKHAVRVQREVGENTRYVKDDAGNIIGARAEIPVEPRFETFQTAEGPIKQKVTSEEVKLGGVSGSNAEVRRTESLIRESELAISRAQSQARRAKDPSALKATQQALLEEQAKLGKLKADLKTAKSQSTRQVEMDRFEITPARKDFLTRQDVYARRSEYQRARQEMIAAKEMDNPAALDVAFKNHENVLQRLFKDGLIDEPMLKKATKVEPGKEVEKALAAYAKGQAPLVELPAHMMARFDELGYKPVARGDDVLEADEISRFVDLDKWDVGDYTRRAAIWETLGLSPKLRTDKALFEVRRQSELAEMNEAMRKNGIELTGKQAYDRLHKFIETTNHEGAVWGPFAKGKTGRPHLYKVDPRDLNAQDVFAAFEDVPGFTDAVAKDVYGAIRRGAAYGHELRLMKPLESARAAGQLLRLNGLPGFADLARTWHLKSPHHFDRTAWSAGEVNYKPKASMDKAYDLAHSPNRTTMDRAIDDVAKATGVSKAQANTSKLMLDTAAETSVKMGRFSSVDDFYKHLDVAYAERYAGDGFGPGTLYQYRNQELRDLFEVFEEGNAQWYQRSKEVLDDIIPLGHKTTTPYDVELDTREMFSAILAATSPRTPVADNIRQAEEIYDMMRRGDNQWGQVSGVMESKWNMLDDIAQGRLPDQWNEAWEQGVYKVSKVKKYGDVPYSLKGLPKETRERMKVWNFYRNLRGDLDNVTVDTWMGQLYDIEMGDLTKLEQAAWYDNIAKDVRDLADEMTKVRGVKVHPAEVQAALWTASKHIAVAAGAPKNLLDSRSFADLAEPMRRYFKGQDINVLKQRVADDVRGLTAWGEDGLQMMRFYRDADFTTLAHEGAHLMRRLMAPEDLANLERKMGVVPTEAVAAQAAKLPQFKPVKLMDMRAKTWKTKLDEMVERSVQPEGGATFNPRTGEFHEGGPVGAVAMREGTDLEIPANLPPEQIRQRLSKFAGEHRKELENPDAHIGTWNNNGTIEVDVSEVVPKAMASERAAARGQKAWFDLETFETMETKMPVGTGGWPEEAEERFARAAEAYFTGKVVPGARESFAPLREALRTAWGKFRSEAVESNYVSRGMRSQLDKMFPIPTQFAPPSLAKGMMRGTANRQTAGGALVGATVGAYEGKEDGVLDSDIIHGAAMGAGAGMLARKIGKKNYGYLPDSFMRLNTALRYSLSFTFDAGRFTEQNMIAMAKYQLPPMMSPMRNIKNAVWKSPLDGKPMRGQAAWDDAIKYWDGLNGGGNLFKSIDDLDRRMYQTGMLGFSPRNWEVAQAYQLSQRGWTDERVGEAIANIGRYGLGRTAAEKSANFIVFPFSFSKKFLTTMGDFVMQAPGRNLLLHEGVRRYYESEADEKFDEFLTKHAPLLKDLASINTLAFGMSPGRFFLQGLSDHRTLTGTAAQAITSFFVPSGAATSLAQAAGNLGDLAVNAFTPVVLTGQSINEAGGINNVTDVFRRYVPMIRELDQYFLGMGEMGGSSFSRQIKSFMEGGDPYWQFSEYQEGLKQADFALEPIATALGYDSVDGFLQSDQGALYAARQEAEKERLREQLPTGFAMSQTFENTDAVNAAALMDLGKKEHRTEAEDRILSMQQQLTSYQQVLSMLPGLDTDMMMSVQARQLREQASKYVGDSQFVELWNRFFMRDYGPITRVA